MHIAYHMRHILDLEERRQAEFVCRCASVEHIQRLREVYEGICLWDRHIRALVGRRLY
jgi:hypothetical protein